MPIRSILPWKVTKWYLSKSNTFPKKIVKWIYRALKKCMVLFTCFKKYDLVQKEHFKHFGRDFPDKTFYVIRILWATGLLHDFLFVANHISYALSKGYVPVVNMENYSFHHRQKEPMDIGGVITSNAWEYYFEQPFGHSIKDIKNAKKVVLGDMIKTYTSSMAIEFEIIYDETEISNYYTFFSQYCRINHSTMEYINKTKEFLFGGKKNILGVSYRATGYIGTTGHAIPLPIEQVIEKVSSVMYEENFDYIYICTEAQEMVDELYKYFPKEKIICFDRERFREDNYQFAAESIYFKRRTSFQLNLDYLTDEYLLSQCDGLVAANKTCGLVFAVCINNNKYRYKHIFDLGVY